VGTERNNERLPAGLALAPLWRRAVAVMIDVSIITAVAAVGKRAFDAAAKSRQPVSWLVTRFIENAKRYRWERLSSRGRLMIQVVVLAFDLQDRDQRGPGARVMGLRSVELRTGGPIRVSTVLIRHLATAASRELRYEAIGAVTASPSLRLRELQPRLRELERRHADDKAEAARAMKDLLRAEGLRPFRSWAWTGLCHFAAIVLPVLLSPRRQSIPDRLAGVVVVADVRVTDDQN